jgi:hypothetical protein
MFSLVKKRYSRLYDLKRRYPEEGLIMTVSARLD